MGNWYSKVMLAHLKAKDFKTNEQKIVRTEDLSQSLPYGKLIQQVMQAHIETCQPGPCTTQCQTESPCGSTFNEWNPVLRTPGPY